MSAPDYDVVIVGAGIAGAGLAVSLLDSGLRIALVEGGPLAGGVATAAAGIADYDHRVSAITPASQSLLETLQVWSRMPDARLCPYRTMQVWDGEGTGAIAFDAAELDVPVLGHIVENRVLNGALLARLVDQPSLTLLHPVKLVGLRLEAGCLPVVELDDGSQLTARLVVGADGALSRVRTLANFKTREWDYGHEALVCTVETELGHEHTAYQRFLRTGPLAFLPLPSQQGRHYCSIVWSLDTGPAQAMRELDDEGFAGELAAALEHRLGAVLEVAGRSGFPLRQRHAIDYVQPGVALVGDAAHTIHPLAGQGINLGLADVAALSREITGACTRNSSPGELATLGRYQRQRKGENLLMMSAMDGFKRLFAQQSLPLRWLRNTGMTLVGGNRFIKQNLMRHAMGIRNQGSSPPAG